ncbi:MAG: ferrous iron transport protein B, partial [Thermoanaerobaculia bacterium]|nr:ferrous iron transport protein B [Thermoanaerobaculia bacterium]
LDMLLGRVEGEAGPDAVLVLADATNLTRNLFLATQILELGVPVVLALNMMDRTESIGLTVDSERLSSHLKAPVIEVVASSGQGVAELKGALLSALERKGQESPGLMVPVKERAAKIATEWSASSFEVERALIDVGGAAEHRLVERQGEGAGARLVEVREELSAGQSLAALEARARYGWISKVVAASTVQREVEERAEGRLERLVAHPIWGSLLFLVVMATIFQAVFAWATPIMELIDAATAHLGQWIEGVLPAGALSSLLVDGVLAGVGSVVIFLPQILILFAFIIFLEDSGYMARAAFLMDRLMRFCGLSGQSFIPMLSSFACAVPGIMATRVIPSRRDRLATMLAAPFMTCSARLPVYALLIAAFIPDHKYAWGFLSLRGLVLLSLYLLGIVGGVGTALLLKKTLLRGPTPTFLMELPPFRRPNLRSVSLRLWERSKIFLVRAGTVIFTVAVVVWALAYFPRPHAIAADFDSSRSALEIELSGDALAQALATLDNEEAATYLEQSFLGRIGKGITPVFAPLGWDWRVSAAVVASFPAREVVLAVLGTIYAVGSDVAEDDPSLVAKIRGATHADGRPVFSIPMALGVMVFFAFCLQCGATVAAIRRETNSWSWPLFAWCYMTAVAYVGAWITYRGGLWLLGGGA